jgi:hypothetical protein
MYTSVGNKPTNGLLSSVGFKQTFANNYQHNILNTSVSPSN